MSDTLRELLDEQDDEISSETVRNHSAWVNDAVPLMQKLAEALDGLAYALDEGDPDEIEGFRDAAESAFDDVERHGVVID